MPKVCIASRMLAEESCYKIFDRCMPNNTSDKTDSWSWTLWRKGYDHKGILQEVHQIGVFCS